MTAKVALQKSIAIRANKPAEQRKHERLFKSTEPCLVGAKIFMLASRARLASLRSWWWFGCAKLADPCTLDLGPKSFQATVRVAAATQLAPVEIAPLSPSLFIELGRGRKTASPRGAIPLHLARPAGSRCTPTPTPSGSSPSGPAPIDSATRTGPGRLSAPASFAARAVKVAYLGGA